ncbi:hypothetical protein ColTof4_01088 [Colletotrichum tofieldiae]|nr:hypothetical protein ColTof3_08310 [Colletotrichum tofieldiae]GKT68665.1 hypothetical protein ColTof4_01088 [Colletotrichum tofieldiae]
MPSQRGPEEEAAATPKGRDEAVVQNREDDLKQLGRAREKARPRGPRHASGSAGGATRGQATNATILEDFYHFYKKVRRSRKTT